MPEPTTINSTTQQFLDIYDVTNDVVIMRDGSTSLILAVDAINFGLLAEEEQDAIMYAYAGLLNSLNYPIQILIRSQTKDVSVYLRLLEKQAEDTFDERKKQQIMQYRRFVSELIKERNVLDKKFYVVIPASALELGLVTAQSVIPGVKTPQAGELDISFILDKALSTLHPKRDHLVGQFSRIGLYARQLTTQEIIRLFYVLYNPEASEGQEITHTRNYTSPVVSAQIGGQMTDSSPVSPVTPTPTPTPQPPAAETPAAPTMPDTQVSTPTATSIPAAATAPTPPAMTTPGTPATPAITPPPVTPSIPNPMQTPPVSPMPQAMPGMPTSPGTTAPPTPAANPETMGTMPTPTPTPTMPGTTPAVPTTMPTTTAENPVPDLTSTTPVTPAANDTDVVAAQNDAQAAINSTLTNLGVDSNAPASGSTAPSTATIDAPTGSATGDSTNEASEPDLPPPAEI